MYDLRQFKPSLYAVIFLGLTGFAMAAESPGLWAACVLLLGMNAWLVWTERFAPFPRWLANMTTLLALGYILLQLQTSQSPPLVLIGQFLALLQIVKLCEQRANRDYAQALVLSLLLMVGASINTASLMFAVLLLLYLVLSLYCCLLFHLKVEADRARAAFPVPPEKVSQVTLEQDRRFLPRSMRRLTGAVSLVSTATAVLVFIFFPRVEAPGVLSQLQFRPMSLTGFSERVDFDQINRIRQNDQIVARVTVWRGDRRLEGTEVLMLRGLTLDSYGPDPSRPERYRWSRSVSRGREEELADDRTLQTFLRSEGPLYRQRIRLEPTGTRFLFALPGLVRLASERRVTVHYYPSDGSLEVEPLSDSLEYEALSTNAPSKPDSVSRLTRQLLYSPSTTDPRILEQIRQYTIREDVAGELAARHSRLYPIQDSTEEIARRIERHLRTSFTYSLDLTPYRSELQGQEPVLAFLTRVRQGHCEHFASAMTLMCQSVGIRARMVVGFRCDEYNSLLGGYYIVRQSHAHSWVEVLTPRGWVGFDPTSGREDNLGRRAGLWQTFRQFLDFLEYKWGESVVAYSRRDREDLIRSLDAALTRTAVAMGGVLWQKRQSLRKLGSDEQFWTSFYSIFSNVLTLLIVMMVLALGVAVAVYLVQRQRLRRRALRIGFAHLPPDQQIHLARQLAFFDQLTLILQKHRIMRPAHRTVREFSQSLVFLPGRDYRAICRLASIFYRVRFGQFQLNGHRQRRLEEMVRRLAESLERALPRRRPT